MAVIFNIGHVFNNLPRVLTFFDSPDIAFYSENRGNQLHVIPDYEQRKKAAKLLRVKCMPISTIFAVNAFLLESFTFAETIAFAITRAIANGGWEQIPPLCSKCWNLMSYLSSYNSLSLIMFNSLIAYVFLASIAHDRYPGFQVD